jgi:hypothetical protein
MSSFASSSVYYGRHRNSRRRRRLGLALAQCIEFLLEMALKRGHILRRLSTTKAHKRIFETQLAFLWCEACYHLKQGEPKKTGERNLNKDVAAHLCKLMLIIEPSAYIGEREKEPSAWTKRIVMSFSLERRTDQI